MRKFIAERWFLVLLVLALALGFGTPAPLRPWTEQVPDRVVVACVLFLMSVSLDSSAMFRALRRPVAVGLAVAVNFVLVPLAAWPLSFLLHGDLAVGLMIAAALPSTLASAAVWTRRGGGNDAVAILCTMITNMACFVVTPLWLVATTGATVEFNDPPHVMMLRLAVIVVLPMLAGQLARRIGRVGEFASRHKIALGVLAQLGILSIVLVGSVDAGHKLASGEATVAAGEGALMLALVVGLHLAMLYSGHLLGAAAGVPREDRIAIGFGGSQKTLMVGLHIARDYFTGLAMLPLIAYHVSQLFVDTLVADRLRAAGNRAVAREAEAEPLSEAGG